MSAAHTAQVAEGAPLGIVIDTVGYMGQAAIPMVIFTLGATLANGPAGGGELPLRVTVGAGAG